jgi:hydroxymethylpyrimidine pyrophosphatase-like HAD family hydrolase
MSTQSQPRLAAFASDLDRTLLAKGRPLSKGSRTALREARALGLATLLVSGRRYDWLRDFVRPWNAWDALVAEDGAVIEAPVGSAPRVLGVTIARRVAARVRADARLHPEVGRVVVSLPLAEAPRALRAVRGLPITASTNIDRVMLLPRGIDKGTGVRVALARLGLRSAGYAAIGDAENDQALLGGAMLSGAVANARPSLRRQAAFVAHRRYGAGVLEFVHGPVARAVRSQPADRPTTT